MAMKSIAVWEDPMATFLKATMEQLHEKLVEKLKTSLGSLQTRLIYRETAEYLRQFLLQQLKQTEDLAAILFKQETQRIITFQDDHFITNRKQEAEELKWFRHNMRYQARFPDIPLRTGTWADMSPEQRIQESKEQEKESAKLSTDAFVSEIMVIAYIRGYYRLAANRFMDKMAQLTLGGMLPEIRERLDFELRTRLGLVGASSGVAYQRLMEEDAATAARRETLKAERDKFVRALETIRALEGNPGLDEGLYDTSSASMSFLRRDRDVVMEDSQTTSELASGEA